MSSPRGSKRKPTVLVRNKVYLRDGFKCQYCLKTIRKGRDLTVDHILPFSKGGRAIVSNLVVCCSSCNCKLADKEFTDLTEKKSFIREKMLTPCILLC